MREFCSAEFWSFVLSGALKKRRSVGEVGDPWEIPVSTGRISLVFLPIFIDVDLTFRKLLSN